MSRFDRFFARRRMRNDLAEEMQQHLAEKTEALIAAGMSPADAHRAARRAFGNLTLLQERGREVWCFDIIENLWSDTRLALRRLRRSPAFAAAAILTLALGIGANTGVLTLMHALLLRSLPVPEPARLVRIALDVHSPLGEADDLPLNLPLLQSIARHSTTLSGMFGWSAYNFILREDTGLRVYSGAVVSGNTFQVLGVAPAAGRLLTPRDDQKGGGPDGWAAVISHRFWQQHDHASASVIGKHITLADHSVTIVGVAPQGFEGVFVGTHPDFYLPLAYEPVMRGAGSVLHLPGNLWLTTWSRLKPGVSMQAAAAELHTLFPVAAEETLPPAARHTPVIEHSTFSLRPGSAGWSSLQSQYRKPLLLSQALVGMVLLVCCVNLAGLSLARTATREHEFAVRAALGASRRRLIQQPLLESLLLAFAGGALSIAIAWGIDRCLLRFLADREAAASLSVQPSPATLLAAGLCAILCALLFGIGPAWWVGRVPAQPTLRRGAGSLASARRSLARSFFVPAQVALTLVLVVVAGLLSATVVNLHTGSLGFRTENVVFVPADFERLPEKGADLVLLYRRMLARLRQMPGVLGASVAENTPLSGIWSSGSYGSHVLTPAQRDDPQHHYLSNDVGPGYFTTLGTRLLAGRDFTGTDQDSCVLNRSAAARLFGSSARLGPVLGRGVWQSSGSMNSGEVADRECRVIGIVEDAKYTALRDPAQPTVYYPFGAATSRLFSMYFVLHAQTLSLAQSAYHRVLHEAAADTPETEPVSFAEQLSNSIARERLLSILSGFFAALTLLLSGIGVYALMAADVTRRTREIGVRMALGATRRHVLLTVIGKAALLLGLGLVLGSGGVWFAARILRPFLYNIAWSDHTVFLLAVSLLTIAGLAAAALPARRAVLIDPVDALRSE